MEAVKLLGKMDKRQIAAIKQMQAVDTVKQIALPLVNNPAMQLLAFFVAIEALQKTEIGFKRHILIPTLDGNKYVERTEYAPLISDSLGTSMEATGMITALINGLGNSKLIEQMLGSSAGEGITGILGKLLPFLLTKGVA